MRGWLLGSLSKGTLTALSALPDNIIVLRRSMVKIDPCPDGTCETVHMLVCNTSESFKRARLNQNLIMLLDYGAHRHDELDRDANLQKGELGRELISHRERLHRHLLRLQDELKPQIEAACFGTSKAQGARSKERKEILKQLGVIDTDSSSCGSMSASKMVCFGRPLTDPHLDL